MSNVIEVLQERGFIEALTNEGVKKFVEKPIKVYCGFDPTGESLHLGNMVAIMGLAWFQKCGHTPVPLLGGATGMIGDPSGKSNERSLLDPETLKRNVQGIKKNLEAVLDIENAEVLNNLDWLGKFSMIEFLRDVGKYFRIGPMLGKESVRQRMESEEGLSYTEFSYQLLQGYDFLYLLENHNVSVQIGGSDQWGNITAGIDLIRKVKGDQVYGVTFPLLMTSDGKKFGKTEAGAVWLSADKLSPYHFYQYLIRVSDEDVIRLLCLLTFLDMDEIRQIEDEMKSPSYTPNKAQKKLAEEVTRIVHGEEALDAAKRATDAVKPGSDTVLDADSLESIASELPSRTVDYGEILDRKLVDFIVETDLQPSKGQVRRLIKNGGVYVNNIKILDENHVITKDDLIDQRLLLLAVGKKNKILVHISGMKK